MTDQGNQGISGQSVQINAQNLAVGAHSKIDQTVLSDPLGQRQLDDLRTAIESFEGSPSTREALLATQMQITEELQAPTPDKHRLLTLLSSLKELAGPATAVIQAAAALAQVIAVV